MIKKSLAIAAGALLILGLSVNPASADDDSLLWSADPQNGVGDFQSIQCDSDTFTTTNDPDQGLVWQIEQPAGTERCEAVGPEVAKGSTYYLGWSAKYNIGDSTSRYLFQLKCSPSTGTANHPIVLEVVNGELQLQEWTYEHKRVVLWRTEAVNDQWNNFALRVYEHRTKGTIKFWFNGELQQLSNGSTTYTGTTYDGTRNYLKWGVYHPAPGTATQWIGPIRMGTTLNDVIS